MLLPAKCPECGGLIEVDSEKKAANCQFCGNAFIVEDAVNNFNTYFNVTNIYNTSHNYGDGAVVNVYEDKSKDFVIEGGVLKEYHGTSLTPVVPEGVVAIEGGVFKDSMITKVTLPSTLKELRSFYKSPDNIGPFYGCKSLEEVNLPEGIKSIPSGCFYGCNSLVSIKLPDSVTSIDNSAFMFCESLSLVTIGNGVTDICCSAFQFCSSLASITIPKSVKYIGDYAFCSCTRLSSVTLSNSAAEIKAGAFHNTPYEKEQDAIAKAKREAEEQAEKQRIIADWKEKGLCQHCGGYFNGLFTKKCAKCGKEKDYK